MAMKEEAKNAPDSSNSGRHMSVPITLTERCSTATRLACALVPMQEISEVTQVPIFWPMTMGAAMPQVMLPVSDSACNMPMEAAEL